jgi:thioredoxin 1
MLDSLRKAFGWMPAVTPTAESGAAPARPHPRDVTDRDFAAVVLDGALPAVVDIWADWCQPCQIMSAYIDRLAQEYDDRVLVAALDADENSDVTQRYQIMGLPTVLFFRGGQEVDRAVGVTNYEDLKRRTERLLNS